MSASSVSAITETALRHVVDAAAVHSVLVRGTQGGFTVEINPDSAAPKYLVTVRGEIRRFASIDTAGAVLRELGLPEFRVDMEGHQPGRLRAPRPDRALALRKTRTQPQQQKLV
ncbi:MAG: hypothetical protein ACREBU_09735 [Nitrososphaera sp.]